MGFTETTENSVNILFFLLFLSPQIDQCSMRNSGIKVFLDVTLFGDIFALEFNNVKDILIPVFFSFFQQNP